MSSLMEMKSKKTSLEKKKFKNPFSFIAELRVELKKVSWTTKAELLSATKAVVIATFCFGIGIYLVDLLIRGGLQLIKYLLLFVFG